MCLRCTKQPLEQVQVSDLLIEITTLLEYKLSETSYLVSSSTKFHHDYDADNSQCKQLCLGPHNSEAYALYI